MIHSVQDNAAGGFLYFILLFTKGGCVDRILIIYMYHPSQDRFMSVGIGYAYPAAVDGVPFL